MNKPDFMTDEHLEFLDKLRGSGIINMLGAVPYLLRDFPNLWIARAKDILFYWMETFPRNEANG